MHAKIHYLALLLVVLLPGTRTSAQTRTMIHLQGLLAHPSQVDLGNITAGETGNATIWLVNPTAEPLEITTLELTDSHWTLSSGDPEVAPGDSTLVSVSLEPTQNILYRNFLLVECAVSTPVTVVSLAAQGVFPEPRYVPTRNLWGEDLKEALFQLVDDHNALSYSAARQAMFSDLDNVDGAVQCVYTGQWVQTTGIPDPNVMNTEHTWPQSMGAQGDARTDLHHLFPTMNFANSARGNLPFGIVVNADWESGGSRRGANGDGQQVFEPREVHKGNVARAMFYFCLRYHNPHSFLNQQEEVLRTWCSEDPVDETERERNNGIYALQNNRNPFVDHPEFLERISSLSGTAVHQTAPQLLLPRSQLDFPDTAVPDTVELMLPLLNTGNAPLLVGYIQSNEAHFLVGDFPAAVAAGENVEIPVWFVPTEDQTEYWGEITVSTTDPTHPLTTISLTGHLAGEGIATENPGSGSFSKEFSIAPNPFNPTTSISFYNDLAGEGRLRIYNIRGEKVEQRQLGFCPKGELHLEVNGNRWPGGVYFLEFSSGEGGRSKTARLILAK